MTVQINPYEVLVDGGKPYEWANVRTSLMVLTDPDLRRGYDETGKIGEKAIDNDRAAALQLIDQEVAKLINAYITNGFNPVQDPRRLDIPAIISANLNTEIDQADSAIITGREVIKFYEDMRARFVVRDAAAVPEDSIGRMIVNQIDGAKPSYAGTSTITNFFVGTTA